MNPKTCTKTFVTCSAVIVFMACACCPSQLLASPPIRRDVELHIRHAVQTGDWKGLESAATEWMHISPDRVEVARLLGYVLLAQGRSAEAEKYFLQSEGLETVRSAKSFPLHPDAAAMQSPVGLLWSADFAARNGDTHAARERASDALALAPSLSVARLFRASLDVRDNRLDFALDDLAKIREDDPVWKEARLLQALVHLSQGNTKMAEAELQPLIESNPPQPLALNAMGVVKALAGRWPEATEAFAQAFSASPQFADAKRNWRLARGAADAPGSVLALRTDVMEANRQALDAIRQGNSHSLAAAWDTAASDTMRDLSPYAKGAGAIGALTKNPALAIGGTFSGDFLNRAGERSLQNASRNAVLVNRADQDWDRSIGEIMHIGATLYPGSPQARAYEQRLARVQISPVACNDTTIGRYSELESRGGVKAELTEPTRAKDGSIVFSSADSSLEALVVAYPIFIAR